MGKCIGCNKKLGFFEGYGSFEIEFCKECYPKRKEMMEKKEMMDRQNEQKDYEKRLKEEDKEKNFKWGYTKNYVLFLDIFCGLSILGALMWFIPALLIGDFTNMPKTTFNILLGGLMVYLSFWILMQLVLYFSKYKNWSLWFWSGPILLFGIIFTYLFYFVEYRPLLIQNKSNKNKQN